MLLIELLACSFSKSSFKCFYKYLFYSKLLSTKHYQIFFFLKYRHCSLFHLFSYKRKKYCYYYCHHYHFPITSVWLCKSNLELLLQVSITPEVTSRGLNRAVMKQLLEKHGKTHFNGFLPAYDGRKGFYTAGALPFTSKDFNIKLIDRDESGDIK